MSQESLLKPGENCWRIVQAERAAFLIDGEAYYAAFREAIVNANDSILIVGWDFDSRIRLTQSDPPDGLPVTLGDLLNAAVSRRGGLHAHVLAWDFAMIYALEREWLPLYKLGWRTHRRLHYRMDEKHPPGASHHQKIVVVDDAVAFVGGFDLSKWRWDTPEHKAEDTRRRDPDGKPYPPFHDVQMIVDGNAAAALGELVRERWRRATGRKIRRARPAGNDPWPKFVEPELKDIDVAVARTQPRYRDICQVREVERLYVDAITAAKNFIYIENQYLTCNIVGNALAERLGEANGPEIIIVLPKHTGGWLEQKTMDVLRSRLLTRLRDADKHGRMRVYYPDIPGLAEDECISVHAKIMVIDDVLVRIGSSNLSNRSMGLDTECDLAIEANGHDNIRKAITAFRERLLAEHLNTKADRVSRGFEEQGSLIAAVEALRGDGRSLHNLDGRVPKSLDEQVPESEIVDPERPITAEQLSEIFVPKDQQKPASRRGIQFGLILLTLIGLAAAWRWTPLGEWLNPDSLRSWIATFKGSSAAPLVVIGGFIAGGLLMLPVTLMIIATAAVFGSTLGFIYSLAGALISAVVTYLIGQYTGRDMIRRIGGTKINQLSRAFAKRGVLTMMTVRVVPVAPFTIINLVAGASHIRFRDYALGTLLGMTPGVLGLTVFVGQLESAIRDPNAVAFAIAAAVGVLVVALTVVFRRWARRQSNN